ncbi:hypothetical protein JL722_11035 [Aureococcus anophagefferens]|nr:hypothetical protein JL722_11035 [Aureococcus anophagefferens]
MDGAVAYAAVEHVAWEARIGWGESSDEGSEGEPERAYRASAPGNAYLDAGDWAGAVRWGGDGESDDERGAARRAGAGAARPAPGAAAFSEPSGRRKRKRERRGRSTIEPAAARGAQPARAAPRFLVGDAAAGALPPPRLATRSAAPGPGGAARRPRGRRGAVRARRAPAPRGAGARVTGVSRDGELRRPAASSCCSS